MAVKLRRIRRWAGLALLACALLPGGRAAAQADAPPPDAAATTAPAPPESGPEFVRWAWGEVNRLAAVDGREGLVLAQRAVDEALRLGDDRLLGLAYAALARAQLYHDTLRSIESGTRARRYARAAGDDETVLFATNMVATGFSQIGDHEQALDLLQQNIREAQRLGAQRVLLSAYVGISVACWRLKAYDEALAFTLKAREIFVQQGGMPAASYNNEGLLLMEMGRLDEAEPLLRRALAEGRAGGQKTSVALTLSNLGEFERLRGNLRQAEEWLAEALAAAEEVEFDYALIRTRRHLARVRMAEERYPEAWSEINQSVALAERTDDRTELADSLEAMVEVTEAGGLYDLALGAYKRVIALRDQFANDRIRARAATVAVELESAERERELVGLRMREAEQARLAAERESQLAAFQAREAESQAQAAREAARLQTYQILVGALAGVAVVVLLAFLGKRRAHRQIVAQKGELEAAHARLQESNTVLLQSLEYAERIQRGMLPSPERLREQLGRDHVFVVYQPRDVVAGDFYWHAEIDGEHFLAVGDCTGHGVPGAFLSIVALSLLREVVVDNQVRDPGQILDRVHDGFCRALAVELGEGGGRDGLELLLVRFFGQAREVAFAGAGLPLLECSPNGPGWHTAIHRGVNRPLGDALRRQPWQTRHLSLPHGGRLYLATDGLFDLVDPQGRRFGRRGFESFLRRHAALPATLQQEALHRALAEFRGPAAAYDDVTLVGLALPLAER